MNICVIRDNRRECMDNRRTHHVNLRLSMPRAKVGLCLEILVSIRTLSLACGRIPT